MSECRTCPQCVGARAEVEPYFELPAVEELCLHAGADAQTRRALRHVVALEWAQFDRVSGLEGRARCQDNALSFFVFRTAQYLAFPEELMRAAERGLLRAEDVGDNLIEQKYARMMRRTDPGRYAQTWASRIEPTSDVKACVLGELEGLLGAFYARAAAEYPETARHGRINYSAAGEVGAVDYLMAELACYSLSDLWLIRDGLARMRDAGANPVVMTYGYTYRLLRALGVQ